MTTSKTVRVRMAPSPTGPLHVGTARTALFNELFAQRHKGVFILRIEDTDPVRSKKEFEKEILNSLKWLGIAWDEGPDIGGEYGPYRQSERTSLYRAALARLLEQQRAYACFCPPGEPRPGLWHCSCRTLPYATREQRMHSEHYVIRFFIESQTITFQDLIRGTVTIHTDSFGGDFIIARSLNEPLYHLAVVVDDAGMAITHVIRGEDHVSNTPKHILLQQALEVPQPHYAHVPLLLDDRRRRLSKRRGAVEVSVEAYREAGFLPEALLNYLALLGWNPGTVQEFFTHQELGRVFSLDKVQKSGAVFSAKKLKAINRHYVRQLSDVQLVQYARPFLEKAGIPIESIPSLAPALATERNRVSTFAELPEAISFFLPDWSPRYSANLLIWKGSTAATTRERLAAVKTFLSGLTSQYFNEQALKTQLLQWIDDHTLGRGETLWPLRVALTGQENSPGPFEVASVLGKEATVQRIEIALQKLRVESLLQ